MSQQQDTAQSTAADAGAEERGPLPEVLPKPTYWPAVTAAGATLLAFGVVTSFAFSAVGLIAFVLGVAGWVNEMRHE